MKAVLTWAQRQMARTLGLKSSHANLAAHCANRGVLAGVLDQSEDDEYSSDADAAKAEIQMRKRLNDMGLDSESDAGKALRKQRHAKAGLDDSSDLVEADDNELDALAKADETEADDSDSDEDSDEYDDDDETEDTDRAQTSRATYAIEFHGRLKP